MQQKNKTVAILTVILYQNSNFCQYKIENSDEIFVC